MSSCRYEDYGISSTLPISLIDQEHRDDQTSLNGASEAQQFGGYSRRELCFDLAFQHRALCKMGHTCIRLLFALVNPRITRHKPVQSTCIVPGA